MRTQLDRLRDVAAGRSTLSPVSALFGLVFAELEAGRITVRMPVVPGSTMGGPGAVLVLADLALTSPIISMLPPDQQLSTLNLHFSGLGPIPGPGATLVATGTVAGIDEDAAVGVSSATIATADGRPVAQVTSRCGIYAIRAGWNALAAPSGVEPTGFAGLHVATRRADGRSCVEIVAGRAHANRSGAMHGGVLAAVLAAAADHALDAGAPRLTGTPLELDLTYLRSLPADGAPLVARAESLHTGSRFAAARAELHDSAGRLAVTATASRWRG